MRRLTVAVAACSLLPVMGSVSWQPSAQAGDALAGHPATRLLFTFDNGESLAPGSRVKDVAGVPDNGRVVTADGGRLRPVDHRKGRAAQFPRRCLERGCPRAIIAVHNRKALNPHRNAFSFGAQVRIKADQTAKTSTIVQKGDYDSRRGRWRLRVNRSEAKPYCLVKGSKGFLRLRADAGVADGRWHTLRCSRHARALRLYVDGRLVASDTGPIGFVSNRAPIRVGGTAATYTHNNQFFGRMDRVFLRISR